MITIVTQPASASPALITATLSAFEKTAVLRAAIDLDVFTAIAEGVDTVEALTARCEASPRGMRVLADSLTVLGFLTKHGQSYRLTPDSAVYLDKRSADYLGGLAKFAASAEKFQRFLDDPAGWVRRGGPGDLANVAPDNPIWVDFAVGMVPLVAPIARQMADMLVAAGIAPRHVLDIAAGHGLYGIEVARRNPHAGIVAVDWAPVLELARKNATQAGIDARYVTRPGDAFTIDFGHDYDLVLVPNFLHHFGIPTCIDFLRRVRGALVAGGRLAILEYVPNEDRVSPPFQALFALTMLTGTPEGDAHTVRDLRVMCREAGFGDIEILPVPNTAQTLVLATAGA